MFNFCLCASGNIQTDLLVGYCHPLQLKKHMKEWESTLTSISCLAISNYFMDICSIPINNATCFKNSQFWSKTAGGQLLFLTLVPYLEMLTY